MTIKEENISLTQKGTVVVMKQDVPDKELNSKDILDAINELESAIDQLQSKLKQTEASIPVMKDNIEKNTKMFSKVSFHKDWANKIQDSKVKAIVDEIKEECFNQVNETYKIDPTLTDEQNARQKYRLYLAAMSKSKRIVEEINTKIMQREFYIEPKIPNPWL